MLRKIERGRRTDLSAGDSAAAVSVPCTMGDGTFSGGFPKKTFARELGMRGPTLIADEFATSRECPCGLCKLEDVPPASRTLPLDASRRPRRHTGSNGPSSPTCCVIKPFTDLGLETDRDEFGCMSILLCTAAGLQRKRPTRPACFCSENWRKIQLAPSAN
jgi:hypothetical protein